MYLVHSSRYNSILLTASTLRIYILPNVGNIENYSLIGMDIFYAKIEPEPKRYF